MSVSDGLIVSSCPRNGEVSPPFLGSRHLVLTNDVSGDDVGRTVPFGEKVDLGLVVVNVAIVPGTLVNVKNKNVVVVPSDPS